MLHDKAGSGLKYKKGGYLEVELTDKEVEQYIKGGYVLEELSHGGSHEGDPPNNLTYAQKKQAYNDSLTLYNWTKNLRKLENEAETFPEPTVEEKQDNWLYDERLRARADGVMRNFMQAASPEVQAASGNPQYIKAITRLAKLNQEEPGYKANWVNVPDELNKSLSNNWTSYDRPTTPVRKPTMKEAYENVDKEKYPTFEDFEYAAEFYNETGTNPDPQDFPSRRLPPPPEPQYEVEDIEPEIKIDRLPITKPTLTTDNNLEIVGNYDEPEELVRPDYSNYQGIEQVRDRFNPKRRKGAHKMRQRISARIAQALTGYDAEKMDAEIEAADKEGRRINFENMGLGAVSNKKFRKKYNQEYDKYEEGLKKQEYLKALPRFFENGGFNEDDELKKQALLKQQKLKDDLKEEVEAFNKKEALGKNLISELNLIKDRLNNNNTSLNSFSTRFDQQTFNPLTFDLRSDAVKENERLARSAATKEIEDFYKKKELLKQEQIEKSIQVLKDADWKGIGNNALALASKAFEPLTSTFYNTASNISNVFENYHKTLELNDKEVGELKDQGYIVEEVEEVEEEPIYLEGLKKQLSKASFDDWYADKVERYEQAQSVENNNTFTPIMANHPANAFRNQNYNNEVGMLYDGPITPAEKFGEAVGEYVDAAVGLPKKIYEGVNQSVSDKVSNLNKFVSDEISDLKDKWNKSSILPANIAKPIDYYEKFGFSDGLKEYLISENSKYPITNTAEQEQLMLNNENLNKDLQSLNYKLTDPDISDAEKLEYQKQFDQIVSQKQANVVRINKVRAEQTGGFDMWFNLLVPNLLNENTLLKTAGNIIGWDLSKAGTDLKQIVNKVGAVDRLELSQDINPKFETYDQKLERETDHYLEDKRFDDLDVSKKDWYRWRFRASASNKDPFMVSIYGSKGERNTNAPNILGQGALFHFLDQSPLTGYQHSKTKNFIKNLKPNDYIGVLEQSKDDKEIYALKYKQKKDFKNMNSKNSFYIRTNKFDDINFDRKTADYNFPNHKYWTRKSNGEAAIPISIAPDPNLYDASSGQSVVFIFKYMPKSGKEQQRYIHFAGSPNEIKMKVLKLKVIMV